ncbi:MAG: hypothetical protein V2I40_00245 [Desulfobacteraceae bacterium]|jgi:hypothetical protein|nr:hypothetical protein [Desulfobacteraceae bacterium]
MIKQQFLMMLAAVLIAGLAGCASLPQPFDYHDDRDEKPGPGLFSGEKGGFVIYGEPPAQAIDPEETPTASD